MTTEDLQRKLGISRGTVYLWVRQGRLRPHRAGRRLLFHEEEILRLLRRRPGSPGVPPDLEEALDRMRKGVITGKIGSWRREDLHARGPR